jgi:hypothetical protein
MRCRTAAHVVVSVAVCLAVCLAASSRPAVAATAAPAIRAATQPTLNEKCQELLARWRDKFDAERLSYLVDPPFVLAGDGGEQKLRGYLEHTLRASADAMHRQFFTTRPTEPILILLFETEKPYRRLASQWFGDEDVSHFGYFRRGNVMLMNVGTGTGTLVHELTHALMKPDFPDAPDWFNEGLGSLFEQCTLADPTAGAGDGAATKIRGLTNWRLPALQQRIRAHTLRSTEALIEDPHFYEAPLVGPNYAQARYLLMYLQEKHQLEPFYKNLRATHATDPTGLTAFQQAIAPQPLSDFDQLWRQWVLTLHFP